MQVFIHVLSRCDGHDWKNSMFFLSPPQVYKHNTSVSLGVILDDLHTLPSQHS